MKIFKDYIKKNVLASVFILITCHAADSHSSDVVIFSVVCCVSADVSLTKLGSPELDWCCSLTRVLFQRMPL